MKKISKMMSHLFVFAFLAGTAGFAYSYAKPAFAPAKAATNLAATLDEYQSSDFEGEVEASTDSLSASITQSATTETSQSLTFSFESVNTTGYKTSLGNFVVQIDDPNFTGDVKNPAVEGYEEVDEATGLPLFHNGRIARIVGGSTSQKQKVYLPKTLTREASFVVEINTISSLCVVPSPAKGEKEIKNAWAFPSGKAKITDIYIPNTITEVENNAFTGVPASGVTIHYDANELPVGFDHSWTDAPDSALDISEGSYNSTLDRVLYPKVSATETLSYADNFILGCTQVDDSESVYSDPKYNVPLVVEYETVKTGGVRTKHFQELELINTVHRNFDVVGNYASSTYFRTLSYRLEVGEEIDDSSFIFHNVLKFNTAQEGPTNVVNVENHYYVHPRIKYSDKQKLSNLVSYIGSMNSTFCGYSMFTLKMSKNLSIVSEKHPEPHSIYLDVRAEAYETNLVGIKAGTVKIRYSLYNLYSAKYHFTYVGKDGSLKDVVVPISSVITYQTLEKDNDNLVSILLKNTDVASDFSAEKVKTFELQDITFQLDLLSTSSTGGSTVLGKSQISYKFAYISVIQLEDNKALDVFNWNLFLVIFMLSFAVVFAGLAFVLYRILKEKFKNDEFRRVNSKKYLKKAILGGLGSCVIVLAILFIIMRFAGFKNTIVVFNPTDPFVIGFTIAGAIILGYFIVLLVKAIKTETERRRIIKLKLDEDELDDGTN